MLYIVSVLSTGDGSQHAFSLEKQTKQCTDVDGMALYVKDMVQQNKSTLI